MTPVTTTAHETSYAALGDPYALPKRARPVVAPKAQPVPRREHDTGLGIPDPQPTHAREIPPEQSLAWEEAEAEALRGRLERLAHSPSGSIALPAWVSQAATGTVLVVASLLGLSLAANLVTLVESWSRLPAWAQVVSGALASVCTGVIVFYLARLGLVFGKLRRVRQVNLAAFKSLETRRELQQLASEEAAEAVRGISRNLATCDLANAVTGWHEAKSGDLAKLEAVRKRLLETAPLTSPQAWLQDYAMRYQAPLDALAKNRVEAYARRAGLATAACPSGLVDQMLLLYLSANLLADLLRLYEVRPAWGQSAVLLSQCLAQVFLAGLTEEALQNGAEQLGNALEPIWGAAGGSLAKGIASRTAEGGLHWFLVRRLGHAAIRLLQPVRQSF